MIYKWAEPGDPAAGSGSTNPLDRIEALIRCTNDPRLVQWICQRAGGFFIRNPKTTNPHPHFLIPATNEIVQDLRTCWPWWRMRPTTIKSRRRSPRKFARAGKS